MDSPRRRTVLGALGTLTLAGCTGQPTDSTTDAGADDPTAVTDGNTTTAATSGGTDTSTATPDLDLREANVVGVSVEESDGSYRFDVTLYHDDEGEGGYADGGQVERLDGTRLGRRDLAHPHGTRRFTRSATVDVPDDVPCVVVRGHDQTHGYGGQAMLLNVGTGATQTRAQGPDRLLFDDADCP